MSAKNVYEVEKILDKRVKDGKVEYQIKWLGYPESESTWEPLKNLKNVKEMVDDYEQEKNKEKLKKILKIKDPIESSTTEREKSSLGNTNFLNMKRKSKDVKGENQKEKGIKRQKKEEHIPIKKDETQDNLENKNIVYKRVLNVSRQFIATVLVEIDGIPSRINLPTSKLKKIAPLILIQFYEAKIKFVDVNDEIGQEEK